MTDKFDLIQRIFDLIQIYSIKQNSKLKLSDSFYREQNRDAAKGSTKSGVRERKTETALTKPKGELHQIFRSQHLRSHHVTSSQRVIS